MKKCRKCGIEKTLDDFNWRSRANGTRQSYCRECQNEINRKDYRDNSKKRKAKVGEYRKAYRNKNKLYVCRLLEKSSCVDCGEDRVPCLQFDHIDPEKKTGNVSRMVSGSREKLKKEIEKCEIRCANCHAVRTSEQFDWYKFTS